MITPIKDAIKALDWTRIACSDLSKTPKSSSIKKTHLQQEMKIRTDESKSLSKRVLAET